MEDFTRQDEWQSSQETHLPYRFHGHHVAASEDDPQYLVESDKTGKQAAHKPDALKPTHE